jgi:hypothetical protein
MIDVQISNVSIARELESAIGVKLEACANIPTST